MKSYSELRNKLNIEIDDKVAEVNGGWHMVWARILKSSTSTTEGETSRFSKEMTIGNEFLLKKFTVHIASIARALVLYSVPWAKIV